MLFRMAEPFASVAWTLGMKYPKTLIDKSLMPPMDLRSSTHPDPSLYYNDDFEIFNVAWSKPFSNLAGYFYKLNTALPSSQSAVPSAQSVWLATESHSFDSGQLGYNYHSFGGTAPAIGTDTWKTPKNLHPGTYSYFCRVHPFMRGSFRVIKSKN